MADLQCVVVTPEATALEVENAQSIVVPLFDGEFGIRKGHSPMIGRLGYGELRVTTAKGTVERYYVDGGFVQVADNVVSVLTGRLVPPDQLDHQAAQSALDEALKRRASTDELLEIRERAVAQARAQLRLTGK